MMRRYLPDAYLLAILLTFVALALALLVTDAGFGPVVQAWGDGIYGIVGFAMQMLLILVTGHVLALTPAMNALLARVARLARSPGSAGAVVILTTGLCCWFNWGFGLIMGGLLAMEIARRNPHVDLAYLIGAAYSGYICWHMGLSGSIPLVLATAGHPQNLIEQFSGSVVPVSATIFQSFNLVPQLLIFITLPVLFARIHPPPEATTPLPAARIEELNNVTFDVPRPAQPTFAERIDHSQGINLAFGLLGLIYLGRHFWSRGLDLNVNIVIFVFFIAGVLLHRKPINTVRAFDTAIRGAAGIALQFPLYGGIQGIMAGTGLAKVLAGWFVAVSSPQSFYLLQFWAAGLINVFIPSGGGQWAAQGPVTMEAAQLLGIDPTRSAMMVAWGDQWTNMIQPLWALPLVGLARLSVKDVMGYTVMTLIWSGLIFSTCALLIGYGVL